MKSRMPLAEIIIRPPGTVVPDGLMFYGRCFFSPRVLRGPSTDRLETMPHDRKLAEFCNASPKIGRPPPEFLDLHYKLNQFPIMWQSLASIARVS